MQAILCVPPPTSPDHPLLGIASIAAVMRSRDIEVEVLDLNALLYASPDFSARYWCKESFDAWTKPEFLEFVYPSIENILEEYLCGRKYVDIFGLHVSSASREISAMLGKKIKSLWPESLIIAGGPEFYEDSGGTNHCSAYDIIFFGEAEASLALWIDKVGIKRSNGARSVIVPSEIVDLNALPMPFFKYFHMSTYARPGVLPMETSRGCVNRCTFCDDARMWKYYRRKSDQRIRRELAELRLCNIRQVSFCDSVLNPSRNLFHRLLRLLGESGLPWDGMIQAKEIGSETAKLMRLSHCSGVFIGIESFSLPFLQLLNKDHSAIYGLKALEYLATEGIKVSMGLIIAGPPLQSRKDFEYDLYILRQMASSLSSVAINPLCIPSGTILAENGPSLGIQGLGSPLSWKFWHAGKGMDDLRLRLEWCREAAQLLAESGVSLGANYREFDNYLLSQLHDAEIHFRSVRV